VYANLPPTHRCLSLYLRCPPMSTRGPVTHDPKTDTLCTGTGPHYDLSVLEDAEELPPPPPMVVAPAANEPQDRLPHAVALSPGNRKRATAEGSAGGKAAAPQPKAAKLKQQPRASGSHNAGPSSHAAPPAPPVARAPASPPPPPTQQDVLPAPRAPTPAKPISAACPLSTHEELTNLENHILQYMAKKRLDGASVAQLQSVLPSLPGLSESVKSVLAPAPAADGAAAGPSGERLLRCLEEICTLGSTKMMLSDGEVYSTIA
jgi:hypothetical protein